MATIREVSAFAGVSVATVSRVVNGNKWVSEATRQKVLDAMAELGYEPNSFARSLATNKSDTVGMVVGDLSGPYFGEMMQQAEAVIRSADKHLIITSGHATLEEEQDAVQFLMKRRCDALILHLDLMSDQAILALADSIDLPLVLVNRMVPELQEQCVWLDNEAGGFLATQHLIEQGHTDIACITGPLFKADARDRLAGYRRALEAAGLTYDETRVVESDFLETGGAQAVDRLHRRRQRFTGLVCGNDLMAIGAINTLRQRGIQVPRDCSVVGYDDVVISGYMEPGLTTVRVPAAEFGAEAGRLALKLSRAPVEAVRRSFQPELVVRQSTCAPVASPQPDLDLSD